jgi:hypothetical protein
VSVGNVADLLLLDADPVADIHNVSRIAAVILNGRLIDIAMRERLLNDAAQAASPTVEELKTSRRCRSRRRTTSISTV